MTMIHSIGRRLSHPQRFVFDSWLPWMGAGYGRYGADMLLVIRQKKAPGLQVLGEKRHLVAGAFSGVGVVALGGLSPRPLGRRARARFEWEGM
ncbi:hypothetical protein [Melaminivora sp.]